MGERETLIRVRAYERWEKEGRPLGRDLEHWLAAERALADEEAPPVRPLTIGDPPPGEKAAKQRPPAAGRKRQTKRAR